MSSNAKIVLLTVAFFAMVGGISWLGGNVKERKPEPQGLRRLSGTVTEKFVYRNPKESHPRATCDACRVGKLKFGVFSVGAFNTLEFDNLVVNLPDKRGGTRTAGRTERRTTQDHPVVTSPAGCVADFIGVLDLEPLLGMSAAVKKRIAGVKVNGFWLNEMEGAVLRPLIQARMVKNKGSDVMLYNVSVFRDGKEEKVSQAKLELVPAVRLVWVGGSWTLE